MMEASGLGRAVVGLMVVVGVVGARVYLKRPNPNDPVINVAKDDARMAAAEKEARDRWPEFLESFRQKPKGMTHAVKYGFPVKGGDGREFIWLEVKSIAGGWSPARSTTSPTRMWGTSTARRRWSRRRRSPTGSSLGRRGS